MELSKFKKLHKQNQNKQAKKQLSFPIDKIPKCGEMRTVFNCDAQICLTEQTSHLFVIFLLFALSLKCFFYSLEREYVL